MMKRGIIVLLFILISACSVNAMTVDLVSPSDLNVSTDISNVYAVCKVTKNDTEELTSLNVWFGNNESTSWQAGSSAQSNPTSATEYTFSLASLANATYTWNCLAENNETNQQFADSNRTFTITFTEAAPPVVNTAPSCTSADTNITISEDSGSWTLDANMTQAINISCSDADGNALTYTINSQTGSGGTFSLSSNDILNFATDANASGIKTVIIDVSDGTNTTQVSAEVNVTEVNDPPYMISAIPNKTWDKDDIAKIDLTDYFADPDDSVFNYSYTFTSSSPYNIQVTIEDDGEAVFTPDVGWIGTETLTFTAYDSANLSFTSNAITLTVEEEEVINDTAPILNQAPVITSKDPSSDPAITLGESQTFKITKSDPDGDTMNVSWYIDGIIQSGKTGDSFIYMPSTLGVFVVKVTVSDGQAATSNSWALTVRSAQQTPPTTLPPAVRTEENATVCGDGTCSGDEDQFSCCKDCGCPESYECNEDSGKCTKEKKTGNIILLVVILGLFVGGAAVGLYLYKKKQEQDIFGNLANTSFELPPKKEAKKDEKETVKKEEKKEAVKQPQEPAKKAEEPSKNKTTSQVLLKDYIITNLKKGKTLEQIKQELHKVGWREDQIDEAYTAAKLDETFS